MLGDAFFKANQLSLRFDQAIVYEKPDSRLHFIKSDSGWKRARGKAMHAIIHHTEGTASFPVNYPVAITTPLQVDGDAGELLSSEVNYLPIANNPYGLEMVEIFSQPGEHVKVKAVQKLLRATLLCEPPAAE